MAYAVLDLETTNKESYKRKANPFDAENRIVLFGYKIQGKETVVLDRVDLSFLSEVDVLIGQNFKFDMHYLWDYPRFQQWIANGGRIFDTMIAEYIIEAQQPSALSLDELAYKYGGTRKTRISKLIKGKKAKKKGEKNHPPQCPSLLYKKYPKSSIKYCKSDVENTEIVALKQLSILHKEGQLTMAKKIMESVLAITEMEWNGLYIERKVHAELKEKSLEDIKTQFNEIQIKVADLWPVEKVKFKPTSNDHISLLFFGGELKYKEKLPKIDKITDTPILIKSGVNKGGYKTKTTLSMYCQPTLVVPHRITVPVKKIGFFKVNDKVIASLAKKSGKIGAIAKLLQEYKKFTKDFNTYYKGFEKCIYPDSYIHGSLNQATTYTGRLASSKPNLQNLPKKKKSEIKKVFVSRFGDDGVLIEADFKQLEVVGAAFLSNDPIMKAEINSGVDMHLLNAEWVFKKPKEEVTDDERTMVKQQTFQLLYGASAYALSLSVGCSKDEAQAFIDGFYNKYKGVAAWHKKLEMDVYRSAIIPENGNLRSSIYKNITGRKLKFTEAIRKNGNIEFKIPDIKNYPVQSFATGDIVPIQIGRLYRALLPHRNEVRLINTVHDSVLLDCKKKFAFETCKILQNVLEYSRWMMDLWNIDFDLPLKIDISIGRSWYDLIKAENYFKLNPME